MKTLLLSYCGALLLIAAPAASAQYRIEGELWARPLTAPEVLAIDSVQQLLQDWQQQRGRIDIQHPGGEEGQLWGDELRNWLIAFGIAGCHIRLLPGLARRDHLQIVLQPVADGC